MLKTARGTTHAKLLKAEIRNAEMETGRKSWFCIQNGAREHYAVPRALNRSGRLEALFTEVWAGPALRRLAFGPLRAMAERWHQELDPKAETLKPGNVNQTRHPAKTPPRPARGHLLPEAEKGISPIEAENGKWKADSTPHPTLSPFEAERETPPEIVSWNWQTVWRELCFKIGKRKAERTSPRPSPRGGEGDVYTRFVDDGKWFSKRVRDYLARHSADVRGKIIFSYDTTALELFRWAKERGAFCVLGQMDPGRLEMELVREEERRWPGWAIRNSEDGRRSTSSGLRQSPHPVSDHPLPSDGRGNPPQSGEGNIVEAYFQRREQEWKLADRIIVNSRWSFDALVKQGVPEEKLIIIPLCYEPDQAIRNSEFGIRNSAEPLHVLFLGQVILRKGIQYLIEAAKLLQDEPVHFDVVGPVGISEKGLKSAPANLTFHGRVNRDEAAGWYERADVFVLPTLSDGFALTQLEAMAHGLPVIATPHCGEVVSNGVDGFIVPARDAVALAAAIRRFLASPDLRREQWLAARERSRQFSLEMLAGHLQALEKEMVEKVEKLV